MKRALYALAAGFALFGIVSLIAFVPPGTAAALAGASAFAFFAFMGAE